MRQTASTLVGLPILYGHIRPMASAQPKGTETFRDARPLRGAWQGNDPGTPDGAPVVLPAHLLLPVFPYHLLDFLLHRLEVEAGQILHRRIVDGGLGELRYVLLHEHEAPELARIKVVHVPAAEVVQALAPDGWGPLKGILTDVDHGGHVGRHLCC